eukprot:scaffold23320_cov129-Isochrysis_galbana.AAC.5
MRREPPPHRPAWRARASPAASLPHWPGLTGLRAAPSGRRAPRASRAAGRARRRPPSRTQAHATPQPSPAPALAASPSMPARPRSAPPSRARSAALTRTGATCFFFKFCFSPPSRSRCGRPSSSSINDGDARTPGLTAKIGRGGALLLAAACARHQR